MSDKLEVVITGKNGVSRVFKEVTSDATAMGTGVAAASEKSSRSMQSWSSSTQKAGAAFGALSLLSLRVSGEAEASQARLEGAFENAGIAIDDYSDAIDRASGKALQLGFDDEDAADSLARFVGVTQDADRALADLALAEDIARGANIGLSQATALVVATENGRFRSMQQIGIKLGETATAQDYLAAAQERYAGASERFATTGAADFERWQNSAENALESVGAQLNSIQGPLLALSAGSTVVGSVGGLLKETAAGAALTSVALGPVGLTAAALAAGAGILYLATRTEDYTDAANQATLATDNLENFFASLAATLDPVNAKRIDDLNASLNALITDAAQRQSDLDKIVELSQFVTPDLGFDFSDIQEGADSFTELTRAQLEYLDTNDDLVLSVDEINAAIASYTANTDRLTAAQIELVQADITNLLSRQHVNIPLVTQDVEKWVDQLNAGTITGEQFVALIENAAAHFKPYILANQDATIATKELGEAMSIVGLQSLKSTDSIRNQTDAIAELDPTARQAGDSIAHLDPVTTAATQAFAGFGDASQQVNDFLSATVERTNAAADALAGYADALGQTAPLGSSFAANFATQASAAGAALGDAFRTGVGNVQSLGSDSDQIDSWARSLINVKGEYGKIDDLLRHGTISQEEYNDAQLAGTRIFQSNKAIQEDLLKIQTDQAPVIAELMRDQKAYIDTLADLPADQQMLALAYMDTAEAAKAQSAMALAAAAANGELGKAGEESAQQIIAGAAAADPYLKAMLEDLGLIKVDKDTGEITVDFGQVEAAGASLDDVVAALGTLTELIANIFRITIESNAAEERDALQGVLDHLNAINGKNATYHVTEVRSTLGVALGSPNGPGITAEAHGGVIPAAHGDVLVGEFGPELLHRTGGGGLVLPTGATKSHLQGMSGVTVQITVQGNVYGMDDLTEQVVRQLVPAIQLAGEQYYAGQGIR